MPKKTMTIEAAPLSDARVSLYFADKIAEHPSALAVEVHAGGVRLSFYAEHVERDKDGQPDKHKPAEGVSQEDLDACLRVMRFAYNKAMSDQGFTVEETEAARAPLPEKVAKKPANNPAPPA